MNTVIQYDEDKRNMLAQFIEDNGHSNYWARQIRDSVINRNDEEYLLLNLQYTYYRLAWSFIKAGFIYKDRKWAQPEIPTLNIYSFSYICYYIKCGIKELK